MKRKIRIKSDIICLNNFYFSKSDEIFDKRFFINCIPFSLYDMIIWCDHSRILKFSTNIKIFIIIVFNVKIELYTLTFEMLLFFCKFIFIMITRNAYCLRMSWKSKNHRSKFTFFVSLLIQTSDSHFMFMTI